METKMKANEWLLDNKFIQQITRGRRSAENNIRLHEAYLSGVRFTDWQPTESTDSKGNYTTKNAAPAKPSDAGVVHDISYTYPEGDWQAFAMVNGKRVDVGMRECCSNCYTLTRKHVSLVGHWCDAPSVSTVIGQDKPVRVTLEPRKTPLPLRLY